MALCILRSMPRLFLVIVFGLLALSFCDLTLNSVCLASMLSVWQWLVINLDIFHSKWLRIIFLIFLIPNRDNIFLCWARCATQFFALPKKYTWQTWRLSLSLHSPSLVLGKTKQFFILLFLFAYFCLSVQPLVTSLSLLLDKSDRLWYPWSLN